MAAVLRHFWLVAIAITFVNGVLAWRRAQPDIASHPEKADGYRRLVRGWMFWGNVGWIVMGAGILFGGVRDIAEYLYRPRVPWAIAWYAINIGVSLLGLFWIFRMGGAEQLAAHPVFLRHGGSDPRVIRFTAALSLTAGILALVLLWSGVFPLTPR